MSSQIMPPAKIVLETAEDLVYALANPEIWQGKTKFQTRSNWLVALVAEITDASGFAYNDDIEREARRRLGLPMLPDREIGYNDLSTLVYNAQGYRRSDIFEAEGCKTFTPELLEQAHREGKRVLINGKPCKPKQVSGRWYAFKPRARTRAYAPDYHSAVKLVE